MSEFREFRNRRLEKQVTATNFSVQDRRLNARRFQENKERKALLLPLSGVDLSTRLHFLREDHEGELLDSGVCEKRDRWRKIVLDNASRSAYSAEMRACSRPGGKSVQKTDVYAQVIPSHEEALRPVILTSSSFSSPHTNKMPSHPASVEKRRRSRQSFGTQPNASQRSPSTVVPSDAYTLWVQNGCPTTNWFDYLADSLYLPEKAEKALLKAKYSKEGTYTREDLAALVRGTDVEVEEDDEVESMRATPSFEKSPLEVESE